MFGEPAPCSREVNDASNESLWRFSSTSLPRHFEASWSMCEKTTAKPSSQQKRPGLQGWSENLLSKNVWSDWLCCMPHPGASWPGLPVQYVIRSTQTHKAIPYKPRAKAFQYPHLPPSPCSFQTAIPGVTFHQYFALQSTHHNFYHNFRFWEWTNECTECFCLSLHRSTTISRIALAHSGNKRETLEFHSSAPTSEAPAAMPQPKVRSLVLPPKKKMLSFGHLHIHFSDVRTQVAQKKHESDIHLWIPHQSDTSPKTIARDTKLQNWKAF